VRGRSAVRAAALAKRAGLPLGLHLDLTETPPCAPPASIATLLDAHGHKRGKHGLRDAITAGELDPEHVRREADAQFEAFQELVGAPAEHVDGHQHAHTVPFVAEVLAPLFAARGVRTTRIPEQREVRVRDATAARFYRSVSDDAARSRAVFAAHGVRSTEAFVGLDLMGTASSERGLRDAVCASLDARSIELMVHPGYVGSGVDAFNESPDREHELAVLLARPFAALVDEGRLRLVSFAALRDA
jgi:predicted glycoside hydrolase/deacetylase ChbG (UPF0249 family)